MVSINNQSFVSFKNRDITFVIINLSIYRIFSRFMLLYPKNSGSGAALSAVFSGLWAFLIISIIIFLFSKFKKGNILDAAELSFGNFGKTIVASIILFYTALSALVALGEFSHLAKLIAFPTAPLFYILIFFTVAGVFGALGHLYSLLKLHSSFMPLILFALILLTLSTIVRGDFSNLLPVLGKGSVSVFGKGLGGMIMYSDILLILLISPSDLDNIKTIKSFLKSTVIGIIFVCLFVFALNVSIPYTISSESSSPLYLLLKQVYYGRFFQRIDAIILFASAISGMLYLSFNAFIFSGVLANTFNIKSPRRLTFLYFSFLFIAAVFIKLIPAKIITSLVFVLGFSLVFVFLITLIFTSRRSADNEKA